MHTLINNTTTQGIKQRWLTHDQCLSLHICYFHTQVLVITVKEPFQLNSELHLYSLPLAY